MPDGTIGNMVCTILHRRLPPMIRFNLRDLTKIVATDRCACGSCFRRMQKMLGPQRHHGAHPRRQRLAAGLPAGDQERYPHHRRMAVHRRPHQRDGVVRDEMTVQVEVRNDAGGWDGPQEHIEKRLHSDLGLRIDDRAGPEDALMEWSNRGREGKPKRILDRRFEKK